MGVMDANWILVGKPEGKRSLERHRRRLEGIGFLRNKMG
jgi:hypothetical protein